MRDLDFTKRDMYGQVSFAIKSSTNTGIERLLQKVTIMLLSESNTTYFNEVVGSEASSVGKYLFGNNGTSDFRIVIADNIAVIRRKIMDSDASEGVPFEERLKNLMLQDVLFDNVTKNVVLSILVESNSVTKTVKLPVK
jgi:hypothetical protein